MAQEKITPLNGNIIIGYEPPPEKTESGIFLAKPKVEALPNKGYVKAVAPDVDQVKVGDFIVFKYNLNKGVNFNDQKLILVPIEDVVGIITED